MVAATLQLTEENKRKLDELARQTGKSPDELANEAIERLDVGAVPEEQRRFQEWRDAMLKVEGMWKQRQDLPDFAALRRSWNRCR